MKKMYQAPNLFFESIVPDSAISSCLSGECDKKGYNAGTICAPNKGSQYNHGSIVQETDEYYYVCAIPACS